MSASPHVQAVLAHADTDFDGALERLFALLRIKSISADPAFADDHPNFTHWQDADGKWCYAAFRRWGGERCVRVDRDGGGWGDDWWVAGLRE